MNPAFYYFENKLYIRVPVSYGFFTDKYWGQGDETPETGNESYTRQDFSTTLYLQSPPKVFAADRSGLVIDYNYTEIVDRKDNSLLNDPDLIGADGGAILGFGVDLTWDSRDNIFFPNKGGYQYFKFLYYAPIFEDYKFLDIELDVRHYWSIKEDQVIAVNFYLNSVSGDTPFYKVPALGGSQRMRGYFYGRYRDND
jgi:outer membrane protein assembly factor BamA